MFLLETTDSHKSESETAVKYSVTLSSKLYLTFEQQNVLSTSIGQEKIIILFTHIINNIIFVKQAGMAWYPLNTVCTPLAHLCSYHCILSRKLSKNFYLTVCQVSIVVHKHTSMILINKKCTKLRRYMA